MRPMNPLNPTERRALRAAAHALHPVVMIGHAGLTPAVMHEIDVNLLAHELIKVRVLNDDREEREAWLESICTELGAAAVQHIGKLLVLYRPRPQEQEPAAPKRRSAAKPEAPREPARPKSAKQQALAKKTGGRAPLAKRPTTRRIGLKGVFAAERAPATSRRSANDTGVASGGESKAAASAGRRRSKSPEGQPPELPSGNRRRLRGRT